MGVLRSSLSLIAILLLAVVAYPSISWYQTKHQHDLQKLHVHEADYKREQIVEQSTHELMMLSRLTTDHRNKLSEVIFIHIVRGNDSAATKAVVRFFQKRKVYVDGTMLRQIRRIMRAKRHDYREAHDEFITAKKVYETRVDNGKIFSFKPQTATRTDVMWV